MIDPSLIEALEQIKYRPVIEAPAPSIAGKLDLTRNAVAVLTTPPAQSTLDKVAINDYRAQVEALRTMIDKELPGAQIKVLDRTSDIADQVNDIYKKQDYATKIAKHVKTKPGAWAFQNVTSGGERVGMVSPLDPSISPFELINDSFGGTTSTGDVTEAAMRKFYDLHEIAHHLGGDEAYADTFAMLRMIQEGAPKDMVRYVALLREAAEWGGHVGDNHFSSSILWKIEEERSKLESNPKFKSLNAAELAGLAQDFRDNYGLKKHEQIFVRDARNALHELSKKKAHFVPEDGKLKRVSIYAWIAHNAERLPWLGRFNKVMEGLKKGPTESLGTFAINEQATLKGLRALKASGDPSAKLALELLTDGKVKKLDDGGQFTKLFQFDKLAYTDVIEFKPGIEKIAFTEGQGKYLVRDAVTDAPKRAGDLEKGTEKSFGDAAKVAPVQPAPVIAANADATRIVTDPAPLGEAAGRFQAVRNPNMFEQPRITPSMMNMPTFAAVTPDNTFSWQEASLSSLSNVLPEFTDGSVRQEPAVGAAISDNQPQLRGSGFLNEEDIKDMMFGDLPAEFGPFVIQKDIVRDIVKASRETGVSEVYLALLADKESSWNRYADPKTTTGRGLFQFLENSWFAAVKAHGAKHGLDREADMITIKDGKVTVADPAAKRHILDLRYSVYLSALMTAEIAKEAKATIGAKIGRSLTDAETYMAHFMGIGGATKLLKAVNSRPNMIARNLFEAAADANKGMFTVKEGGKTKWISVRGLYDKIDNAVEVRRKRYAEFVDALENEMPLNMELPETALNNWR